MKNFLARFVLVGGLAVSALGVVASPADATGGLMNKAGRGSYGTSCPGKPIPGHNFKQGGKQVAALFIYYSPANGGTYCAFVRNYVHNGRDHQMDVDVYQDLNNFALDHGYYRSYAGTVSVSGASTRCTTIYGEYKGELKRIDLGPKCGRGGGRPPVAT